MTCIIIFSLISPGSYEMEVSEISFAFLGDVTLSGWIHLMDDNKIYQKHVLKVLFKKLKHAIEIQVLGISCGISSCSGKAHDILCNGKSWFYNNQLLSQILSKSCHG